MSKLTIHIVPNTSKSHVIGKDGAAWKVRISAPPVEGRANEALIELLSDVLDIPKSTITIIRGQGSKIKILDIGLPIGHIEELLSSASKS